MATGTKPRGSTRKSRATTRKKKEQVTATKVTVDGVECMLDSNLSKLRLGEQEMVERAFGRPIGALGLEDWNTATGKVCLATIARQRIEPGWTIEQTRALEVDKVTFEEVDDPPTGIPATSGS